MGSRNTTCASVTLWVLTVYGMPHLQPNKIIRGAPPPLEHGQISSHRAVLGYLGAEVEWDEAERCRDHGGVDQADDLEGAASGRRAQPQSLPKGPCAREGGDAGG